MADLKLAYCGINCEECPVFTATLNDNVEAKRKTAEEWGRLYSEYIGKKELSIEDMNCTGCQSEKGLRFVGCNNCPIRNCCKGKNLLTCADCEKYETCEMINGYFTSAPQAKETLDKLRNNKQK